MDPPNHPCLSLFCFRTAETREFPARKARSAVDVQKGFIILMNSWMLRRVYTSILSVRVNVNANGLIVKGRKAYFGYQ